MNASGTTSPIRKQLTIVPYEPHFQTDFYTLNEAWIAPHFGMEPEDVYFLSQPEAAILNQGGAIFMAVLNQKEAVGSIGMFKMDTVTYEMIRLAVREDAKGAGIGKKLVLHALEWAWAQGAMQVILESSSRPVNQRAVAMYERMGFIHYQPQPQHRSALSRADVFMVLERPSPATEIFS